MRIVRQLGVPIRFAVGRIRARPLAAVTITVVLALACGLMGWSSIAGALSQEDNVRLRLAELTPDERSIQVVYHLGAGERDERAARVDAFFARFRDVTDRAHRVRLWHSVGDPGIRLVVLDELLRDIVVSAGRRPSGCRGRVCEAVALAGDYRLGERIALGNGVVVTVVGRGSIRPEALPGNSEALPQTPELSDRALLVRSLEPPLAALARVTGSSVVTGATLDPRAVHGFVLRRLESRLRTGTIRLERATDATATAPLSLLDELGDRGEVAHDRLLVIAGQAAALILAFAAFAASARRRESRLLEEQLDMLAASRVQTFTARLVEAGAPAVTGALLAIGTLEVAVRALAARRDLPGGFAASALPLETDAVIAALTVGAVALLVASATPRRPSRFGFGALEAAALAALGVVAWQAASTGALDPARIEAGGGSGPVLLVLPALAFFGTGVVVLRLLPLMLSGAERVTRRAPFGLRFAFLSAARQPAQAAAATTFLAVALGSALFGVNYRATLERQARDEARFTAGAAWRVVERSSEPGVAAADVTPLRRFRRVTGERPEPVLRLDGRLRERLGSAEARSVEVLALPSRRIPSVLGWRKQFSRRSPEEIASRLRPSRVRRFGLPIAADARALRVWARSQPGKPPRLAVLHFLSPEDQTYRELSLGVTAPRWRRLGVALPPAVRGTRLVAIEFVATFIPPNGVDPGGFVELGHLEQQTGEGWRALPSLGRWTTGTPEGRPAEPPAPLALEFPQPAPVKQGIHVELPGSVLPLLRPAVPLPPALPALASTAVAAAAVDGTVTLDVLGMRVPVRVVGSSRLFPTVVEQPDRFVVLDYDTLFAALNLDHPGLVRPSEAWFFGPQPSAFATRIGEPPFRVDRAVGVVPLTARLLEDPLGAGTRQVLGLAALAAAVLGLLGLVFAVRATLALERPLLAEYEALGVPPSTLARSTQVRLVALALLGVAAGFGGSVVAVRLIAAFVAVTGAAGRPLPPIEPVVAYGADATVAFAVGAAALAAAALLAARGLREGAGRRLRA